MKKLILKLDGVKEMLTKEQMKKISGGYGNCGAKECSTDSDCKDAKWPHCHSCTCQSDHTDCSYCGV